MHCDEPLVSLPRSRLTASPVASGVGADWKARQLHIDRLGRDLGFSMKLEQHLSAMERLLPNVPQSPFRAEVHRACHFLKHGLQTGLYVDLGNGPCPDRQRVQAARAVHEHLNHVLQHTTRDYPDELQSVVFLDITSGRFRFFQYWMDYLGANDYAFRFIEESIVSVLDGLAQADSIDLTAWIKPIVRIVRPTLVELALSDWQE